MTIHHIRCLSLSLCLSLGLSLPVYEGVFFSPAFAVEPIYSGYFDAGKKFFKEKRYQDALRQFEMALSNSEHLKPGSDGMIALYDLLGQAYCHCGNQRKAEEYLSKCLAMREASPKKNELEMFGTVMLLGTVYRNENKFAESETLYKRGLSLFQGSGPIKYLCQATVLYALGSLYLERAKGPESQTALEQALKLRDKTILKSALSEQGIYDALGRSYQMQGRMSDAETMLKRALELAVKAKDLDSTAYSEANLAGVYIELSRYDEARKLLESSIKLIEKTHGGDSTHIATLYSNLAEVAINQDRYEEAEDLLNKALAIHQKHLGPRHTSVGYDLSKLISVLRNQGKYQKAEELGRQCSDIFITALGADNQTTAQSYKLMSGVLLDQNRLPEAARYADDAMKIFENLGLTQEQAEAMVSLAEIKALSNDKSAARTLFETACGLMEKNKDADPSYLARTYSDLAQIHTQAGELAAAEQDMRRALALREKIYGNESARVVSDLRALVKNLNAQKKVDEANQVQVRIDALTKKMPDLTVKATPNLTAPIAEVAGVVAPRLLNKWALVIGISNFADPDINLRYAAKDAVDFSNYLIQDAHFPAGNVRLLTDKDATRDNIIKHLGPEWLGKRARSDDLVVVYVSSHGSTAKSEAGGVNFLVAHDTQPDALLSSGIPMQWLSQIIKDQVHSRRVVLILDVCHSGSASAGEKGLRRENNFNVGAVPIGEGQAIICSSAPEQVSWESRTYPNSVFTRRLIEALKQNDGKVNLNQAFSYLRDSVESEVLRDRGKLQTPVYFSKSWQGPPPVLSAAGSAPDASNSR